MIEVGPDHVEGLPFPHRCQCAHCRLVSEVVDRCIETMRAMSVEDRTRAMDDFLAERWTERWTWVWATDGGVLVLMHGNVLAWVSPAEVRVLCGPRGGVATGRAPLRPVG